MILAVAFLIITSATAQQEADDSINETDLSEYSDPGMLNKDPMNTGINFDESFNQMELDPDVSINPTTTTTTTLGGRKIPIGPNPAYPENITKQTTKYNKTNSNGTIKPGESSESTNFCGGSDLFCAMEFDGGGDGKPDCCTKDNNPVCMKCLDECVAKCAKQEQGLITCFMSDETPVCQCNNNRPTCYALRRIGGGIGEDIESQQQTGGGNQIFYYILAFGFVLAALAVSVQFVYKADEGRKR